MYWNRSSPVNLHKLGKSHEECLHIQRDLQGCHRADQCSVGQRAELSLRITMWSSFGWRQVIYTTPVFGKVPVCYVWRKGSKHWPGLMQGPPALQMSILKVSSASVKEDLTATRARSIHRTLFEDNIGQFCHNWWNGFKQAVRACGAAWSIEFSYVHNWLNDICRALPLIHIVHLESRTKHRTQYHLTLDSHQQHSTSHVSETVCTTYALLFRDNIN